MIFATHNSNKLKEARAILEGYEIEGLLQLGFHEDIPETGNSFKANALIKAQAVRQCYGKAVFADDSGLVCAALNGDPGIYSARYAGEPPDHKANNQKLLKELEGQSNRQAKFVTVIAFINVQGEKHFFTGEVNGQILLNPRGEEGFGYDPVFQPEGHTRSFAEMAAQQKNQMSHRARALFQLRNYLNSRKS